MSKWVFRLTGLLVVALIALLFLDRFLNPDVPEYIERGVDVRTEGDKGNVAPPQDAPEVPPLSLTSLEGSDDTQQSNPALPSSQAQPAQTNQAANEQPKIGLTALEEAENIPVLSNPDSQRANVWLQAGSFGERANAEKRAAVLKAQSWSTEIEPAVVEGKTFYRVYVGPLTSGQVKGYLDKLNTMGISAREINR
ncbi:SPOR domain-containing protein [Cardiobacteriaceae bacterium TAE3-ERU3]|nr:SPOR domain-containing protein [Cardiobacteriaceae bacterium TAE3-ERU3]